MREICPRPPEVAAFSVIFHQAVVTGSLERQPRRLEKDGGGRKWGGQSPDSPTSPSPERDEGARLPPRDQAAPGGRGWGFVGGTACPSLSGAAASGVGGREESQQHL